MAGAESGEVYVEGKDERWRGRERGIGRKLGRKVGQGGCYGQSPGVRQDVGGRIGRDKTVYIPSKIGSLLSLRLLKVVFPVTDQRYTVLSTTEPGAEDQNRR